MSKILLFDIETSPLISYTWGIWEQDVIEVKEEWYILSFGYKWLGDKQTYVKCLPDYPLYKREKNNDRMLVQDLWKLFDEADILIAHNGDQFDVKKVQARFVQHKLKPPTPFKTIDTKKVAKKYFKFDSNKLDHLGQYLKIGRKVKHEGFSLWLGCMYGDMNAWKKMCTYNKQDVVLLEQVYLKLRGWMTNHPEAGRWGTCSNCDSEHFQKHGHSFSKGKNGYIKYTRLQCQDCGAWKRGEKVLT